MTWFRGFLLSLLFVATSAFVATGQTEKKQVVFIRYRITPSYFSTVIAGFKQTMEARGYNPGVNIEYKDVLTRSADQASIPDVLQAISKWQDSADMFITCGWVSMTTREKLKQKKVPQLFVPVLESVAYQMLPSVRTTPETNLSGVYLMYPPEKILRLAQLLLPELKRYAYVYDSRIPADLVFKAAYENLTEQESLGISIYFIDLAEGADSALTALQTNEIGAYGGIVGSFKKRKELAASNLPVITSFTLDIEKEEI